jgi:protein-disulfide isomerase
MTLLGYLNKKEKKQIYIDKEKASLIKKLLNFTPPENIRSKKFEKLLTILGLR